MKPAKNYPGRFIGHAERETRIGTKIVFHDRRADLRADNASGSDYAEHIEETRRGVLSGANRARHHKTSPIDYLTARVNMQLTTVFV